MVTNVGDVIKLNNRLQEEINELEKKLNVFLKEGSYVKAMRTLENMIRLKGRINKNERISVV